MNEPDTRLAKALAKHLNRHFPRRPRSAHHWPFGPVEDVLPGFRVVRVSPTSPADPWFYVTQGVAAISSTPERLEFVLMAPAESATHVESLAMVANFHADPAYGVREGKVLNIGRPWLDGSTCDHFLVSLPYPLGPDFEWCRTWGTPIRILWLLPVTAAEANLARDRGVEELESRLERHAVDILDVHRASVAT